MPASVLISRGYQFTGRVLGASSRIDDAKNVRRSTTCRVEETPHWYNHGFHAIQRSCHSSIPRESLYDCDFDRRDVQPQGKVYERVRASLLCSRSLSHVEKPPTPALASASAPALDQRTSRNLDCLERIDHEARESPCRERSETGG